MPVFATYHQEGQRRRPFLGRKFLHAPFQAKLDWVALLLVGEKTQRCKTYELMNHIHENIFLAWVKSMKHITQFCREGE